MAEAIKLIADSIFIAWIWAPAANACPPPPNFSAKSLTIKFEPEQVLKLILNLSLKFKSWVTEKTNFVFSIFLYNNPIKLCLLFRWKFIKLQF